MIDLLWQPRSTNYLNDEDEYECLSFNMKMNDCSLDVFARSLWHYFQRHEESLIKALQIGNKECKMRAVLSNDSIKHLQCVLDALNKQKYLANTQDSNSTHPCLLLWPRPTVQKETPISLRICYNPQQSSVTRLGLQRFCKTIEISDSLTKIMIETQAMTIVKTKTKTKTSTLR